MKLASRDVVRRGQRVGGYRIAKKLGAGGFGHVYLAHRDGVACALKFTHPGSGGHWGWRELYILQRHEFPHVVRLLSHFKWPDRLPEYLVLVMEYVPGPTLYEWARRTNPSARQVVEKLCKLSQALGPMHVKEVLHRDLKGDNILMREPDSDPVIVDFGAGTMPDVPRATRDTLAPANARYRSPESVAFFLRPDRPSNERYTYAVTDELYALGVILYVLLTDQYPFGGSDYELLAEIVQAAPVPPSGRNARVPPALDGLCLRLLAKDPHARLPTAGALCAELQKLLEEARGDPRWDLPLCYGWTEEGLSTEDAPEVVGLQPRPPLQRWQRYQPRRGPRPTAPSENPPLLAFPFPRLVALHRLESRWLLALGALLVVIAALGRLSTLQSLNREPMRAPTLLSGPHTHGPTPFAPLDFSPSDPGPWATSVHEVAPPWKPREADSGAAPSRTDTPALVTPVTLRTEADRMKKKPAAPSVEPKQTRGAPVSGLLLGMAVTQLACPGPNAQVLPAHPPPPVACSEEAVKTMTQKLGIPIGTYSGGDLIFPGNEDLQHPVVQVREGPFTFKMDGDWDMNGRTILPTGTLFSGQMRLGDKLVYGFVTQAVTPKGETFPVCMVFTDAGTGKPGAEIHTRNGRTATLSFTTEMRTVDHFD